jgi:serine/threonine protein kinase
MATAASTSPIPTYIGDWRIERELLGSGSDAMVWYAYHIPTAQCAAVKIIDVAGKPAVRERALAEASILAKLTRRASQALPVNLSISPDPGAPNSDASVLHRAMSPPLLHHMDDAATVVLDVDEDDDEHDDRHNHRHPHHPQQQQHHHHYHHQQPQDMDDMMLEDGAYGHHHSLPNHHIISLLGVEEDSQRIYLFLEYAPRGDLAMFISRNGRLDEDEARKYFRQMVHALEFCHQLHITHHDFKLENLLIGADRNIRLIDFGLAKYVERGGMIVDHFAGSPLYMPPEIFSLQPHDRSVDVWSLGVCLYYMVTDTFPFSAESYTELEEKVLFDDINFPVNMGISDNLQDLLRRLLVKDPIRRIRVSDIRKHSWWTSSRYNSAFAGDRYEEEVSLPPLPASSLPSSASSWTSPIAGGINIPSTLGKGGEGGPGTTGASVGGGVGGISSSSGSYSSHPGAGNSNTPIATSPFAFRPFF